MDLPALERKRCPSTVASLETGARARPWVAESHRLPRARWKQGASQGGPEEHNVSM